MVSAMHCPLTHRSSDIGHVTDPCNSVTGHQSGKPEAALGKPALSVVAGRLEGMDKDEELLRGRVYGQDHDHPRPGPVPGRVYAELVGGPLDGLLLDITGWTADEIQTGVSLQTELGQFGAGGRALYDPRPGERNRWDWSGDTP
jgi:hypothetical protein